MTMTVFNKGETISPLIFILDVEATGTGNQDEVIQLAGWLTDSKFNLLSFVNEYCYTEQENHPKAFEVHGIDKRKLHDLSKGQFIEDIIENTSVFHREDVIFTSYNWPYDMRMINQSIAKQGLPKVEFGRNLGMFNRTIKPGKYNVCSMNLLNQIYPNYKQGGREYNTNLMDIASKRLRQPLDSVEAEFRELCLLNNIPIPQQLFHGALYDSFVLWKLLRENRGSVFA